jgi:cytochrome c553
MRERDMSCKAKPLFRGPLLGLALQAICVAPVRAAGDIALGEYLSAECVTCHQLSGAVTAGVPAIVGLSQDAFLAALMAYKTGIRENQVMRSIAARLTDEEMAALAAYFATRKKP